ncbi:Holliday junction branch migration protein RuvA [Psychrosphaera sp. B3R10]|uniref:Holliday junction branch migration protein RuvA n=1 Tax=unclassified Psychrosphaera TaxID=2641570 RepID=UPI001C0A388C|nr:MULTISPECIES: Holliday junction branch migration protein RuvA [unclassified Psychrosphaera]MBU2881647.1 Holliday junction branch migration protein RuvA [Psychrosphaera sp. I2R16]MBU2991098.1 Holliday junction branch migration protein RuvA [Psychrosphaera sp. B3R10]MDO6721451.1 Holliday junction branch migration protein RuvA [Psychrosphaera sp. 1_MG-2023]
MIGRLTGIVADKQAPDVLIDVNGVGYEVQLPLTSFYELPEEGVQATIYTHFVVREDAQLLYGFSSKQERSLFRLLIKANGVGPKLGLTILSGLTAEQFVTCVEQDDVTTLVKLPGVGKKTAERLLIEMRDRIQALNLAPEFRPLEPIMTGSVMKKANEFDDAVSALVSLGYSSQQANKAVKLIFKDGDDSETLIRLALKNML